MKKKEEIKVGGEVLQKMRPIGNVFLFPKPKARRGVLTGWNSTIPIGKHKPRRKPKYPRTAFNKPCCHKKRIRLPSVKSLKKKADSVFSLYIRQRDKKCVLCGSTRGLSAGHLIKRGKMATRFDENNVFGLCSKCNFKDFIEPSYHDVFVAWYVVNYGALPYADLVDKSRLTIKANRLFFEEIIKKYT